jgi:hypothetical protein
MPMLRNGVVEFSDPHFGVQHCFKVLVGRTRLFVAEVRWQLL